MTKSDDFESPGDLDQLAGRYLDLWERQLAALAGDGDLAGRFQSWIDMWAGETEKSAEATGDEDDNAGEKQRDPAARTKAAAAASDDGDGIIDERARRLAERARGVSALVSRLNP